MSRDHLIPDGRKHGWFVSTPTELLKFDTIAEATAEMVRHPMCSLLRECQCGCGQPAAIARKNKVTP